MGKPQISLALMGLYFIQGQQKFPSDWRDRSTLFWLCASPHDEPHYEKKFFRRRTSRDQYYQITGWCRFAELRLFDYLLKI